jgi:hypothetical protein
VIKGTGRHRTALAASLALAASALAACSSGGGPPPGTTTANVGRPEQILSAPKNLRAAAEPQSNGTMWALAGGRASKSLFDFSLSGGTRGLVGALPVSNSARSVAESLSGVLGLALGTRHSGALELLNGATGTAARMLPLGAPARQVVVGSDGSTFYVLNGTSASASVTIVNSGNDRLLGTVPVPLDTVSIVPDLQESTIYALQPDGTVSQVAVAGGRIETSFRIGDAARSLAISPDGGTLYVLKGDMSAPNVAVVAVATQSVSRILPAPANCLQILVSANGSQLYQMVGTAGYGNIQVFPS